MSRTLSWQLIGAMFALLIVGIIVTVDVSRVVGLVILFIVLAVGLVARLGNEARRRGG